MTYRPTNLIHYSRFYRLCSNVACLLLFALSSENSLAQASTVEPGGPSSAAILQMLLGLLLIIGILFAGAYLLRKLNGGRSFGNSGPLRIVGGLMISARERIVLVEVGSSWLVVGIVPGQIKTLHTLAKGELPAQSDEKPFGQWLKQVTERKNENK